MFVYDGRYSGYRRRSHGRPVKGLSAHRFIGFIQNHDQVGNRATGDRLEHIVGFDRAKVAAGIVLTAPLIPMIFQGEEFAASSPFQYFADHDDPEMAKAVSEGRKREFAAFGWRPESIPDPGNRETFERSKLNWNEVHEGDHAEMLAWFRSLIRLRRSSVLLNDGDPAHIRVEFDEEKHWIAIDRGTVKILCNLGNAPVEWPHPEEHRLLLASRSSISMTATGITVPPDTLAILSSETH